MSTTYTQLRPIESRAIQLTLATILTVSIFAILPLLHIIPKFWVEGSPTNPVEIAVDQPPVVIEPIPEPIKDKEKPEKPVIERELRKIDLKQLEILINAGPGDGTHIDIGVPAAYIIDDKIDDLFVYDQLDKKPKALFQIEPVFPYSLKQQNIEGWVTIEWIITDRGQVRGVKVIQSSHREFQQPAIDSILKSKWVPGEISNKPVNTKVSQKITFNL